MDLLKDDVKALFLRFLIPAISSAIAVAAYSLVDTDGMAFLTRDTVLWT